MRGTDKHGLDTPGMVTLRNMAYCRAIGELKSIEHTYWSDYGHGERSSRDIYSELLEKFIADIERGALME